MMTKTTTSKKALMLRVMIVPIVCAIIILMSTEVRAQQQTILTSIPQKDIKSINTKPVTQTQLDSLRKANPGKYDKPAVAYTRMDVIYNKNGKDERVTEFAEKPAKASENSFTPEFNEKLSKLDSKNIKEINVNPATQAEIDSLKANHKTIADYDAAAFYRKTTIVYLENGKLHTLKQFSKEPATIERIAPDDVQNIKILHNRDEKSTQDDVKTAAFNNLQEDPVYSLSGLEKQPEYPGGMGAFYSEINKNFRIPDIKENFKARIYMSFVVEKDGSMSNIKVLRDPGYGLGDEALRVLKSITNKWEPGVMNGEPVRTSYNLPITMNIGN